VGLRAALDTGLQEKSFASTEDRTPVARSIPRKKANGVSAGKN